MDTELLQYVGMLYVEASRLQNSIRQLQDRVKQQDLELQTLRNQVGLQNATTTTLPPEKVAQFSSEQPGALDGSP